MAAISIYTPEFLGSVRDVYRNHIKFHTSVASCSRTMVFKSPQTIKRETNSIQISTPVLLPQSASNKLRFNRPLPDEEELAHVKKFEFGNFIARKAVINEEIWGQMIFSMTIVEVRASKARKVIDIPKDTAAYLRAETHWENLTIGRNDDIYKKNFAEEEFRAIQKRSDELYGQACTCMIAVRNEQKHIKKLNVIKSVVGTLDISTRHLLYSETFPAERELMHLAIINKELLKKYAYVTNLCVMKSARRQGIGTNLLKFAIDTARYCGLEQLYVHVRRDNAPALALYEKIGFEVVEVASPTLLEVQKYLLCIDTQKVHLDIHS